MDDRRGVLMPVASHFHRSHANRENNATVWRTIAFFGSSPGGLLQYEKWQMWRGLTDAASLNNLNLLYIAGEEYATNPQAILYDLIGVKNVAGIVMWNAFVSPRSPVDDIVAFFERYNPLPVVSIEVDLPGTPGLLLDNLQGMRDILNHLVAVHGYRQIAFYSDLSGSSLQRQAAFEQIMTEYGCYDARLVGSLEELDARGLRPGSDYRAIVASADTFAVTAITQLQARGYRVPDDVAVTGFNDGEEARGVMPALTTLRLPFRQLGQIAVQILADRLAGRKVWERTDVAMRLVLRRSCGCIDPLAEQAAAGPLPHTDADLAVGLARDRRVILDDMIHGMGLTAVAFAPAWAERILDNFITAMTDGPSPAEPREQHARHRTASDRFLADLNEVLHQAGTEGVNVNRWHEALSSLRRRVLPYLKGLEREFAEDLWQQARVLVGQSAARAEVHRNWLATQRLAVLRQIEASLLITFDVHELMHILAEGLPRLGIRGCYIVFYENPSIPRGDARLVLAYQQDQAVHIDPIGQLFPTQEIVPSGWLPAARRYSLVVEALHYGQEQIGFIAFEADPPEVASECVIFDALQTQLSSALKGVRLRQELQEAKQKAEEANQLKSRFLSMVSHELRTPLNLIVGLSEMALREQTRQGEVSLEILKKYQEQIFVSGQHLDRLIRDVLDLASSQVGQMELVCQTFDLGPVLQDAATMARHLAEQKKLQFITSIPAALPKVWGDKTRLRQVLLNLLSNAVKFTARGQVGLAVVVSCSEAEMIQEIKISVTDTGLGIPLTEQEKIFDEFRQSERTAARGYGGIGLGLAITRRLVELHGGKIWCVSDGAEGSGSTFNFTLPVLTEVQDEQPGHLPIRSEIVLIITGHPDGTQALSQHLAGNGYQVETMALAESAEVLLPPEVVESLLVSPPGAVVLDIAPASELGWEIIKRLKDNPDTQDVPVLFFSLLAEQGDNGAPEAAGQRGAVLEMEYLHKPLGTEALVKALVRHGLKPGQAVKLAANTDPGAPNILLVDDDSGILSLHTQMVQEALPTCQVQTAPDGLQALEQMRKTPPDLVILDLMMPELDGFGVLECMQRDSLLRDIPVIVITAQVLSQHEMARLNRGVASILEKGMFSAQETLARIEQALSRNRRLGSDGQRLVRQAMAYIHEHYRESVLRVTIAKHLFINEQYLTRCFTKELGISPMTYLNRYRIQQAKKLLEKGRGTVTQVALEVGFASQSYFSRIFQREIGISPKAYQQGERPVA